MASATSLLSVEPEVSHVCRPADVLQLHYLPCYEPFCSVFLLPQRIGFSSFSNTETDLKLPL